MSGPSELLGETWRQTAISGLVVFADDAHVVGLKIASRGAVVHTAIIVTVVLPMLVPVLSFVVPMFRGGWRRRQQAEEQDTHHHFHRDLHSSPALNRKACTIGPSRKS